MVRLQLRVVIPVILVLLMAFPALGSTITVTNTADSGAGSLRAAVASAAPGDTINFSLTYPATITLSSTIWMTTSVTIAGPGANNLAISGNNATELFYVTGGPTVAISGVTIEAGNAPSGGGIMVFASTLQLTDCAVSGNTASLYNGGGIFNFDQSNLVLNRTTVSGNSAAGEGGGIVSYQGSTVTLINSTVSANSSGTDGGGIVNSSSTLVVINGTIAGNSAATVGGGIDDSNGTLTLKSTLVANNKGGNCSLSGSTLTSDGYNLSDDGSCSAILNSTTDSNNVSAAGLDSKGLQNNGGSTNTIALLPTSPAIDGVPVANCTLTDGTTKVTMDQRGVSRPQGPACDIGAFELVQSAGFSSFNAKLDIDGRHFRLNSTFALSSGSSGINPLTDVVKLQVGTFSAAIPAGLFHQLSLGDKQGAFVFAGMINGAYTSMQIVPLGGNSYEFKAEGAPVDFSGVQNPVPVSLSIGNATGTTSVNADLSGTDADELNPCRHRDNRAGCSRDHRWRE
ncbi:MAG: right-handed parallel beta-helix repeat-containing protein [Acidobacteriota bacterium]|nr:right-handed parallel beta-helix repeat-containing protein [Acidobacteriota bacterium]